MDSEEEEMTKATPVQMRQSLDMSMAMLNATIRFVPIPVMDEIDFAKLLGIMQERLSRIEAEATAEEGND